MLARLLAVAVVVQKMEARAITLAAPEPVAK